MTSLTVVQTVPGTIGITWTSVPPTGSFLVVIRDLSTGLPVAIFSTTNYFAVVNNLLVGHTYSVSVGDQTVMNTTIKIQ